MEEVISENSIEKENSIQNEINFEKKRIYKICITGGPCGGKTTSLNYLRNYFESLDWKVFYIYELAELSFICGVLLDQTNAKQKDTYQKNLFENVINMENLIYGIALNSARNNILIISIRGAMDVISYSSEEIKQKIFEENNWNICDLRDNRYDIVIHLVTTAFQAEKFYVQTNVRLENIDDARRIDILNAQAWMGHPYYYVVDNSTDFTWKTIRLIKIISKQLGVEENTEKLNEIRQTINHGIDEKEIDDTININKLRKRQVKFLVSYLPDYSKFPYFEEIDVVYHYITPKDDNELNFIRKRGRNNSYSYYHIVRHFKKIQCNSSEKSIQKDFQLKDTTTRITREEYSSLLLQKDPNHNTIYIKRRIFIWKGKINFLDIFIEPQCLNQQKLIILKAYSNLLGDALLNALPSFLDLSKNVTHDPNYIKYYLSKKEPVKIVKNIHFKAVFGHDDVPYFEGICRKCFNFN